MNLVYWTNFSKRKNSTKQPTGGTTLSNVVLKENTSLENPTFLINMPSGALSMTYVQWEGRYYFVNDITLRHNNIYEVSCSTDVLATFKTNIGSYTAFVERSASSYDDYINDPAITQKQSLASVQRAVTTTDMNTTGCYVVRCIGKNSGSVDGIGTYVANKGELAQLLTYAFGDLFNNIVNEAVKAIFNPFEYIVSVKWFPFSKSTIAGSDNPSTSRVWLGKYDTGLDLASPDGVGRVFTGHVTRPAAYYNDFRDINPSFTEAKIIVPTVGLISFDPRHLAQGINAELAVDWISGNSTVLLSNYDSSNYYYTFSSLSGAAGCDIQIGQTSVNGANVVGNTAAAVGNLVAGNFVAAGLSTGDALTALAQPTESILGNAGGAGFLKFIQSYYMYAFRQGSKDFQTTTYGRPCYQNKQLSSLSGFIKCANASIDMQGLEGDIEAVNSYLNGGFYYE